MLFSVNLKYLRKNGNLSIAELAEKLGVSRATVGNYETGYTEPSQEMLLKIAELFHVGLGDLMTIELSKNIGLIKELSSEYEVKRLHHPKVPDKKKYPLKPIPVFKANASAGFIQLYDDINTADGQMLIPGYEDCDFAITAFGHSMYPVIENGCLVLCKKISDKNLIAWGEIYFLRMKDLAIIKRLQKSSKKGMVVAVSDNTTTNGEERVKYEPMDIKLDDILDLYLVKGVIKKLQI